MLVDPNKPWTVTKENIASKCGWSPLEGHTFGHSVVSTFVNGTEVVKDGAVIADLPKVARPLTFNHKEWR